MNKPLSCEELVEYLSDYIDKQLDEELSEAAQEHLATCENCRVVLDSTQEMILLYRKHGQKKYMPSDRQQKLYAQLEDAFSHKPQADN